MDFLTNEQVAKLKPKWDLIKPKGAFVILYAEQTEGDAWNDLCDELGVDRNSEEVTICYVAVSSK